MLKSLELVGFKSFAEKTRLEFPPGVTVVVGPNGSGKSNVVDAVKWVLGSQSPRSLRGAEMTDVIFNGAESRGPLASAEVTLAFDNRPVGESGRRLFDFDEEEIRLTRRVHRSGEGEYLVNGRACRLKDFRELLAGTGVGADSYSIIEQGRVDAALRSSPLERRLLLEEAAGISRFRLKKREAAKRLERVEQNLLRLSDIVDEVEGRLRRVRAQAGKAQRYREASLRMKEARTELAAAEWRQQTEERRRLDAERASLGERVEAARAEITEQEGRLAQLEKHAAVDEHAEKTLRELRQRLTRHERDRAVAHAESGRLADAIATARAALVEARQVAAAVETDDPAQEALAAAEGTATEYADSLEDSRRRLAEAVEGLEAVRRANAMHRQREQRIDTLVRAAEQRASRLTQRRDALADSLRELAARQDDRVADSADGQLAEAAAERDAATDTLGALDRTIAETQRELTQRRRSLAESHRNAATARERLVGLQHRLDTLLEEQRRLDRLNDDVERLVERSAASGKQGPQVYGLVADLIHVDEDFVPMVEAALGRRAEHVVVDSRRALFEAFAADRPVDLLTTRAGFQPIDAAPQVTALDQVDLSGTPGVLGRAADFVEVEPRYAALVRWLFARTWFVDTLATAMRLAESVGRGLTFVTLDGETLGADHSVICGPNDAALRMLTRREDGEAIQSQVAACEAEANAAQQRVAEDEARIETLEREASQHQQQANGLRGRVAAAAQQAAALEERRRVARTAAERAASQAAERRAEATRIEQRLETTRRRAEAIQRTRDAGAPPVDASDDAVRRAESRVAAEQARGAELSAAAAKHAELLASLRAEARRPGRSTDAALLAAVEAAANTLTEHQAKQQATDLQALAVGARIALLAIEADAAALRVAQSRAARRAGERIRVEVAGAVAQSRAEADALAQRLGDVELNRQRIDLESRALAQRIRDDYGVDVAEIARREGPALGQSDRQALREEIETLRREVQAVGSVNLESLEELDELENRFAELSGQYQDLSEAKQSLARLTARINTDSRELFQATFEAVREHFRELFARLFGGGEADLLMTEPPEGADPLEGGVEIVACPPGKELRSLSLLSGGEKTMTCVALLLALFRSRPSPFCLLDEVDAALDEANVGRFSGVLKDFLASTQFIVITHSKRTMSGADTIYGVTMQESGVSKQVSVRFEDVSEDGRIQLRRGPAVGATRRAA